METVAIVQITPTLMMSSSRHPAWQTWTLWTTMKRKLETRQVSLDFCFVEISLKFSYIYKNNLGKLCLEKFFYALQFYFPQFLCMYCFINSKYITVILEAWSSVLFPICRSSTCPSTVQHSLGQNMPRFCPVTFFIPVSQA